MVLLFHPPRGQLPNRSARRPCRSPRSQTVSDPATGVPVKIVIGGAPVTPEFADEVGADGFAPDAGSAVDVALELIAAS